MTVLRSGAASDVGRVRANNQDSYIDNEPLFAVADGMGGAVGGEEASETAVAALKATFQAHPTADGLADGVRNANRAVWEKARARPELRGMGTTMTAVALVEGVDSPGDDDGRESGDDVIAVVNVGDSRVYLLRDGELQQVTDDHSVPEELRRAGRITPQEAAVHPQRNVLTRALGIEPDVEVDCFPIIPYKGDRLVLASDGLFNEVDHDGIASVARRERDPQAAAEELVRLAKEGGGNDNITVVVVDVVDDDDRAGRASAAVAASAASRSSTRTERQPPSPEESRPTRSPAPSGGTPPAGALPTDGRGEPASLAGTPQERPPRVTTLRAVVFLTALVLVLVGAVAAIGFFARGGYFVGVTGEEVTVFKGRPGGLLWFEPTIVERTGVTLSELNPSRAQDLRDGKEEPSLSAARRYVANLEEEAAPRVTTTTTIQPSADTVPTSSIPPAPAAP